jgi:hypothetical protein
VFIFFFEAQLLHLQLLQQMQAELMRIMLFLSLEIGEMGIKPALELHGEDTVLRIPNLSVDLPQLSPQLPLEHPELIATDDTQHCLDRRVHVTGVAHVDDSRSQVFGHLG